MIVSTEHVVDGGAVTVDLCIEVEGFGGVAVIGYQAMD